MPQPSGELESAAGLPARGHLGWGFRGADAFAARAAEFLAGGLAAGQRIQYVGPGSSADSRAQLARLPGASEALADGRAEACSLAEFLVLRPDGAVDADASIAALERATGLALAAGHRGFRFVIDATEVARTPPQRDALAGLEHRIDRAMTVLPVAAVCGYDLDELEQAAAELLCLHPFTSPGAAPFRVYAGDGASLACSGEIDLAGRDLFDRTLSRLLPLLGKDIRLDVGALEFVDQRALLTLEQTAAGGRQQIELVGARSIVGRLLGLLNLRNVRLARL